MDNMYMHYILEGTVQGAEAERVVLYACALLGNPFTFTVALGTSSKVAVGAWWSKVKAMAAFCVFQFLVGSIFAIHQNLVVNAFFKYVY